jgi:ribonuclease HI
MKCVVLMYMPFYATYTGHINNGVFETWEDCRKEINKKPKYKKFATREEAECFHRNGPFGGPKPEVDYVVYTDGACRKNGKAGSVGGYGIYFANQDSRNTSVRLAGKVTNNIAELTAVIKAIEMIASDLATKRVAIYTDSTYAMCCCTTYGTKCAAKGWPADIPNLDLVRTAFHLVQQHPNLSLVHVSAHTTNTDVHSIGNRNADELATAATL